MMTLMMIKTITTTMSFSWHTIISEQFSFECSVHLFICHSFHMNTFFCRFFPVILIDQVDKRLIFFLASLMFVIGVIVVVTATKCLCKCFFFFQKVYHIALVSLVFDVFQWFLLHWMCFFHSVPSFCIHWNTFFLPYLNRKKTSHKKNEKIKRKVQ